MTTKKTEIKDEKTVKRKGFDFYAINSAPILMVCIILLVVTSFFSGYMLNKVQTLTKGAEQPAVKPTTTTQVDVSKIAKDLGVNTKEFDSCLSKGDFKQKVADQQKTGLDANISGTPGSFIVNTETGKIIRVDGAKTIEMMKKLVNISLEKEKDDKISFDTTVKLAPLTDQDHIRGNSSAKALIVVYSDLECPFCQVFHTTLNQLLKDMPSDVKIVFRHFPIPSRHPNAQKWAEASECVAKLGGNDKFWLFIDKLFEPKQ